MEPTYVIAGRLRRDYLLPAGGRPMLDVPGGSLLYAAAGLAVWDDALGLLARVGEDYPNKWLQGFEKRGWDTRGIRVLTEPLDLRFFQVSLDLQTVQQTNPVAHFARLGLTFPKALLGYQPPAEATDDRKTAAETSPRPVDLPADYLHARAIHLCPMDYMTHSRLLSLFRQASVTCLTLDPAAAYMMPAALEDVRTLLQGVTAFLPSEEELRSLFWGRTDDLWQMAEEVASWGCELVIVKRGGRGQLLVDTAGKRWEIPAYPARLFDLTGAGDSFSGGFLAGYHKSYDPLRAVLLGSVSASLTVEGTGAFHALEALPGLAQARVESLAGIVREL
jgi:sugar/nucleoside kinase (ribokinase family)